MLLLTCQGYGLLVNWLTSKCAAERSLFSVAITCIYNNLDGRAATCKSLQSNVGHDDCGLELWANSGPPSVI
jgi:hypothetical protein